MLYKEIYLNFLTKQRYLSYFKGLSVTLRVSFFAAIIGILLGVVLALFRLSTKRNGKSTFLSKIAGIYISIVRGTPLLLQVMIFAYGVFASVRLDNVIIGSIVCGLNSAAYVAEIIRGGILSIEKGQVEAGRSLGLSSMQTMGFIVLPQALKASVPSLFNEFIALIKETSVLAYIAVTDLTKAADYIRSQTYSGFTPYIISAIFYFVVVAILSFFVKKLEGRLQQGDKR
ncbi:MAG: amino acid ABC transporter permease [Clostridiales bacterium]|nr:amino acid ABC transporter permease [Clostridiales bacterium]